MPPQFGYKILWFAIKSADPAAVVAALAWPVVGAANWQSGLAARCRCSKTQRQRLRFRLPAVRGWGLVVGGHLPYPDAGTEAAHNGIGARFRRCKRGSPNASPTADLRSDRGSACDRSRERPCAERMFSVGDGRR